MQIARIALTAFVLLELGSTVGCRGRNWSRCTGSNADVSIGGCTALIQSGKENNANLATAFYDRGKAYFNKGQYDRAIQDFDQAIRLKPNFAEAFIGWGNAYSEKGQYDRAIQDYDQAIRLKPNFAEAFIGRGNAYSEKGQQDRAIQDYDQAIRLKPDYTEAFYNRGSAYSDKGQSDRAIQDYDQAIRLQPDYAEAFYNRGLAYDDKGQYDRAIQDFDQSIRLKPDDAVTFYNRGLAYSEEGQYDRAIQDYSQAIRLKPDYAEAFYNRGLAKFCLARYRDAVADFQKSLSRDSSDVYPMLWLHLARKNAGQDDAQSFPQQAGQIDYSKWPAPVASLFLGQLTPEQTLVAASDPDSIKESEQHCEAEFFIGEYFLLPQEKSKALVHFRTARDTCPHSLWAYSGAATEITRLGAGKK